MSDRAYWENLLPAFSINDRGEVQLRLNVANLGLVNSIYHEGPVLLTGCDEDGFMTVVLGPRSRLVLVNSIGTHVMNNAIQDVGLGAPLWICIFTVGKRHRTSRHKVKSEEQLKSRSQEEYWRRREKSARENMALMYV